MNVVFAAIAMNYCRLAYELALPNLVQCQAPTVGARFVRDADFHMFMPGRAQPIQCATRPGRRFLAFARLRG